MMPWLLSFVGPSCVKAMTDRHASRLIVGVWIVTAGVAMAGWLTALGWIAIRLVERVAT
jgi:hypothetical protein